MIFFVVSMCVVSFATGMVIMNLFHSELAYRVEKELRKKAIEGINHK